MDEYRIHARDANGASVYLNLDDAAKPRWTKNWREATTSDEEDTMRDLLANVLDTFRDITTALTREPHVVNRGKHPKKPQEASA